MLRFEISGKPIPMSRPRVTRNGHTYYGKKATEYKKELTLGLMQQRSARIEHLTIPVAVRIVYYGLNPNADLDNAAKMTLDCLVDAGVLPDDNVKNVTFLMLRSNQAPKGKERTVIEIWREDNDA